MLSSICRGLCNPSRFFYDMDRSGNLVETIPCHDEINAMVTLLLWNTHRTMQTEAPLCGCFVKALISHVFLVSKLCFNIHTFLFCFGFLFIDKYEFDTCYWLLYFLYFVYNCICFNLHCSLCCTNSLWFTKEFQMISNSAIPVKLYKSRTLNR